ncbi:MCP methyltransferase/methylesterase, CheR/CheB with PAS/PAC sensor [Desulfamplus magnetovallimortis]|uniref:MCP methyltransferase/methylesterase, CheR/CheB with PAS/PAC sensor n=1 Tax=Desulfamplus magnetovallimortis TaxID=1246637 RepID=A0A1W1HJA6_9BACT|nr:chemotaxis protein CheB [Desulfamplus magnetovallimortis]SLM32462.1 MCP methyltransferase/methylesterase, CheR/CheB with PAS/PAC sensor [Desulfamplus magnetovallimortis]
MTSETSSAMEENRETISSDNSSKPSYIVGIGASAGGLKALQHFFNNTPQETGIAFVIIQHLSPDYKSMMVELLAKNTDMTVCRAEDRMVMEANHIYLITPRMNMTTMRGRLFLSEQSERQGLNLPIDIFFRSLAEDQGERAIGIILSGTGSDGTRGLRAIKAEGGTVFVQNEESAEFDGMPRCAIATGLADFILPPEKMPAQLLKFISHPRISLPEEPLEVIKKEENSFAKLFSILKAETRVDFSYYKPATVIRRIERRMGLVQVSDIEEYISYIQQTPQEIHYLFKDLLIGVTKFFRDREAFKSLDKNVISQIIATAKKRNPPQLRVWDIGSSTGEEAYSIAMLIQDHLDAVTSDRDKEQNIGANDLEVKIFATDIDQQAIEFAGAGTYPESIAADIDVEHLSKYFDKIPGSYRVKKSIRQMVIFAVHNIINDPPFTKIDMIVCRNLLIYFQPVLQKKIFNTINYILQKNGFLFLGNSETLIAVEDAFSDIDNKNRIYKHTHPGNIAVSMPFVKQPKKLYPYSSANAAFEERTDSIKKTRYASQEKYYHNLLNKVVDIVLVINETRELVQSFGKTETLLKIPKGNSSLDILALLPNELSLSISSAIQRVRKENKSVTFSNIKVASGKKTIELDLTVDLLTEEKEKKNHLFVISITRNSKKRDIELPVKIDSRNYLAEERIEDLEREVQFTRENLQTTIEELQATNEELLAANEELQSTNEELQSVNEELNTVNAEYQNKVLELTELNTDMDNLLTSSDIPTIFLDKNLCIRKFTSAMTSEINLLEQDIGRPITDLNLPMLTTLTQDTKKLIKDGKPLIKTIKHNSDWFLQRMLPFINDRKQVEGVVLTMVKITDQKNAELAWEIQHNLLLSILEGSPAATIMTNRDGKIIFVNKHVEDILGIQRSTLLKMKINSKKFGITDLDDKTIPLEKTPLALILDTEKPLKNYIMCIKRPDGKRIILNLNANPTFNAKKKVDGAIFRIDTVAY